jgi:signal transduction histidine kinase
VLRRFVRRLGKAFARWSFTVGAVTGAGILLALIGCALYDFVSTAQETDQQARVANLEAQLANFLLATQDKDGSSLLENPIEFSRVKRSLSVVSLKRSFYAYILNRSNARQFSTDNVLWDMPRPCVVTFSGPPTTAGGATTLEACFAVVPGDTTGRYVYFSIRYPTHSIRRHARGATFADADYVALNFSGIRQAAVILTFEPPALAVSRYPSQLERFGGIHEISAFNASSAERSLRQINAQAFEHVADDDGRNFVTIVGRLDASLIDGIASDATTWPSSWVKELGIGIEVYQWDSTSGKARKRIGIAPGQQGTRLASLEQAYLLSVPSRAKLDIFGAPAGPQALPLWSSTQLQAEREQRSAGIFSWIFDWWADKVVAALDRKAQVVGATRKFEVAGSARAFQATLTTQPPPLPDIAIRASMWFSAALVIAVTMILFGFLAFLRLGRLTAAAHRLVIRPDAHGDLHAYRRDMGEIAALGRVLDLLIRRSASRGAARDRRIKQEHEQVQFEKELVKSRKAVLDAIGHEIRSPLESLLNQASGIPEMRSRLERMRRALDALHEAASAEAGLLNGTFVISSVDLANYVNQFVQHLNEVQERFRYVGPERGLIAQVDDINLETVLDHLFDNALRHRLPGSSVVVELKQIESQLVLSVFNEGAHIAPEQLEAIFAYGVSDYADVENHGIGLFVARSYLLAMKASIRAENRMSGVAMVVTFPYG